MEKIKSGQSENQKTQRRRHGGFAVSSRALIKEHITGSWPVIWCHKHIYGDAHTYSSPHTLTLTNSGTGLARSGKLDLASLK